MRSDWLALLRDECGRSSQAAVARRLELSQATVSQVLSGKYPGRLDRVAARVRGALGHVQCPWFGREIAAACCAGNRERPVPTANPEAVRFWAFCQGCTAWRINGGNR